MSRDYKNIKQKKREPVANRFSHILSFITGLTLGLFIAVIIYFQKAGETVEKNNVLLSKTIEMNTSITKTETSEENANLPEPTFDFYTILPNKEINISEWESVEEDSPVLPAPNQPSMLVLQVGSFTEFNKADEIRAKLALLGINADIQRVVINGQDIRHRVRIGPYENSDQLQQAKNRLLENDLDFMLLKLKMEDI